MKRRLIVAVALATLTGYAAAFEFEEADLDQDGQVTEDEAISVGVYPEEFTEADGDNNGSLDMTEYSGLISQIEEQDAVQ
jgi:hypothetical protein